MSQAHYLMSNPKYRRCAKLFSLVFHAKYLIYAHIRTYMYVYNVLEKL
ncbi:uncharacterized protein Dwil_GK27118 [Drosophila willistoni]|uniref:Uncharacterized protein n=1 Tax=Drosophila willistoni TaxID=7260 RepID=A0A0Q9X1N4_DROWI|nr:uncharacterized protein Dwil_GK27118 [Drosophila willistoni]